MPSDTLIVKLKKWWQARKIRATVRRLNRGVKVIAYTSPFPDFAPRFLTAQKANDFMIYFWKNRCFDMSLCVHPQKSSKPDVYYTEAKFELVLAFDKNNKPIDFVIVERNGHPDDMENTLIHTFLIPKSKNPTPCKHKKKSK